MPTVNMHEAKSGLSKLVDAVENGSESEIILARNGKPVARIVPLAAPVVDTSKRLGIAEGQFDFDYEEFQSLDKQLADTFYAKPLLWEPPDFDASKRKKSA